MANHELYVVQGKTLDNIAGTMRVVLGVEKDAPIRFDEVANGDKTEQINADVEAQAGIIAQIKTALEGKAAGGGGLPDWDDDSPIIASGRSYYTDNITWELTEKGTFRWKIVDINAGGANPLKAGLGSSALSQIPLDYQVIAPKIKQMYAEDGIKSFELSYAVNCERVRIPTTLTNRPVLAILPSIKEVDFSGNLFSTLPDYQCSQWNELERVVLSPLLTTIPARAFAQCYSLKEINLENVTTFKSGCFLEDFSLNSNIVFNANLISIETQAFYRTRIKSVKFQNSTDNLPTIASNAFGQCRELKAIFCPWAEGVVANANGGATNATMYYNVTYDENGNPIDENGNPIVLEV